MTSDNKKVIEVKVYRFDPEKDSEPYYDAFEVNYDPHETILGVLHYIRNNIDSSLVYRDSCEVGCCAICNVRINGKAGLACKEKMPREDMVIEPVKKDKVIRDLVTL